MILTLAFRHALVRRVRALVLLLGFALGVAVMIVLLSVGEAMLVQAKDTALVGGGEVTVLPEGVDIEALRTGGAAALRFGIDRSRYVTRQLVGGERTADVVRTVAPAIEDRLLYLRVRGETHPVVAGGELPSRARAVGAGLRVLEGRWDDTPADTRYLAPTTQQLYDELDRFHLPATRDSTWGEWHYVNVVAGPREWFYLTLLVGGDLRGERWGGQVLVSHHRADGTVARYTVPVPRERVLLDTTRADQHLGASSLVQRDGRYRLRIDGERAAPVRIDLDLVPLRNRYFPPIELSDDAFLSGYVVPALGARATGSLCVGGRCTRVTDAPAYHDHNWGVWRDVTWEWGAGRGGTFHLLYGGVLGPGGRDANGSPFFFGLADSLGFAQVLRFRRVELEGSRRAEGLAGVTAPERLVIHATRGGDSATVTIDVRSAYASRVRQSALERAFVQMRGAWRLTGIVGGRAVADSGDGFFETYVPAGR